MAALVKLNVCIPDDPQFQLRYETPRLGEIERNSCKYEKETCIRIITAALYSKELETTYMSIHWRMGKVTELY